jgi:hypothetical protein
MTTYANDTDTRNEAEVAEVLEQAWRCTLHRFARYSPLDYWAERAGRMVGLVEIKQRSHEHDRYATTYLTVRRWLAMRQAELGLGVPARYVVRFTDSIRWVPAAEVDATNVELVGHQVRAEHRHPAEVEPTILIPIASMRVVGPS